MGDPFPARQVVQIPQRLAVLPVDAYFLAVACGGRGVSLDIGAASHSARRPPCVAPDRGTTSDRSSVTHETLAPQPVAICTPD